MLQVESIGRRRIITLVCNLMLYSLYICVYFIINIIAFVILIYCLCDTGKHLLSLDIYPSDTRDQYLRGTFHGYSLQTLLWGVNRPDSYWTRAMYPTKGTCCSPVSVTFSASEPDKMHMLNYLLYHLHVFMDNSRFGSTPAKVLISENDVSL